MNQPFGEKIRNYRIDMDLSQKEIAGMIPMNQSNYSKIERGLQEPSIYQLRRISEILHVSVDVLLNIDRASFDEEKLNNFQKELNDLYRKYFS